MLKRIITAILLIPLVFFGTILIPNNYFFAILLAIICAGAWEYCKIIQIKNLALKISYIVFIACLATVLLLFQKLLIFIIIFASLWWLLNIVWIVSYPNNIKFWHTGWALKIINGILIFVPIVLSLSFVQKENPEMVFLFLTLVWGTDSGGFIVGNIFGKHKFSPKVSPNKTTEGVIGAFLFSMLFSMIYVLLKNNTIGEQYLIFLLLSILVSFYSIVGDLFESLYKRVAKVKNSGNILPGHGGIFDRIDSLVAAAPIFCLIYINYIKI